MGYSNTNPDKPDWDPATQALINKHVGHKERVIEDLTKGLPSVFPVKLEMFREALEEAFDGAMEAVANDLT